MVAPLIGSPQRPVRRLDGRALDVMVLVCSLAGVVGACFVFVDAKQQMCMPDADGLEAVGLALGLGVLVLLVPGVICTLVGLRTSRRGGLIAGRVLLLVAVLGWQVMLPALIGLAIMIAAPDAWIWAC
ncbi:MAG TPA: hypothetical protein VFE07_16795 [Marmoricola sp.]|nr:hypothetical protein [Marmoricola sp.]